MGERERDHVSIALLLDDSDPSRVLQDVSIVSGLIINDHTHWMSLGRRYDSSRTSTQALPPPVVWVNACCSTKVTLARANNGKPNGRRGATHGH